MICGTSGTFLWYPVIYSNFGFIPGAFIIIIVAALTHFTSKFVIEGYIKTDQIDYMNLIRQLVGEWGYKVACFTFILDYFATYIIGLLYGLNILFYDMYYWGLIDEKALKPKTILEFNLAYP